jgi:hypothetical protein
LCTGAARADKLTDHNATHYGKLAGITQSEVLFDENCAPEQRVSIPRSTFVSVGFDDQCQRPPLESRSSPMMLPCHGEEQNLFTISFTQGGAVTAVTVETVADQLKIMPIQQKGYLIGPISDVRYISYGSLCLERLTQAQWPSSFHELASKKKKSKKKP